MKAKSFVKTISDYRNTFLAASWSKGTESLHLSFSTLILGSVFNDYVVFYGDISLILFVIRVQNGTSDSS